MTGKCLICGRDATLKGLWLSPGLTVEYRLCKACRALPLPELKALVDAAIMIKESN